MNVIRINLTTGNVSKESLPPEIAHLGGRGLTAQLLNFEVPPQCDPLGPDNKLIFAPGLLTATKLVNTGRISIGGKSPLTGGIKESNAGGTMADSLAKLGVAALVLEGAMPQGEPVLIRLDSQGEIEIIPAPELSGRRTYGLVEELLGKYGPDNSVLCIGPAGEAILPISSIQISDTESRPCRAAARGGLGAVMGAKGVKAIVVEQAGKDQPPVVDAAAFTQAAKEFAKALTSHPFSGKALPALGTMALVGPVNSMGGFPSYNATKGTLEGWEEISGESFAKTMAARGGRNGHRGCSRCVIRCSNEFVDQEGEFVTASLEYETAWSLGGMTGVADMDIIAQADRLCDEIGLDTMSAGVAIAVAMDAGAAQFGDGPMVLALLEEIEQGTTLGKILGQGPAAVGRYYGHDRVPVVKNQSIAAYDPRALPGNGVTYATSPMGADHTSGSLVGLYMAGVLKTAQESQSHIDASLTAQIATAALDCTGLCLFALGASNTPEGSKALCQAISAKLGRDFGPEDLKSLGKEVLNLEKEFNAKAGLTPDQDRLPRFFYEEPLPPNNYVVKITDQEMRKALDF